jgi:hypothetical protein
MGPKYRSEGEDEHDGKWEYAPGGGSKEWKTFKDWKLPEKSSEFSYRDGDNIGNKADEFPEVGYQENPEKE